ncbi:MULTISPECIES: Bug family tripartite tricarboxylate transporter substrate binding protein [Ramlibacter]|nr:MULTISPECIES: tripartite tricarboxylate transporter substrate-binding protein [Ramlibacter]MBA2964435.1 tripartite tricarboxylate transporter substrate binding protein [Ramlibacter sp. CGMCC 1.13660]
MPLSNDTDGLRRRALVQALACAPLAAAGLARAQPAPFPSRPVKLLSGATAGSASDVIARAVGEKLQAEFGVPVVIENRAGASGALAVQATLAAPGDGHTILVYTAAHTVVPLISKVGWDPVKDFSAVAPLAVVPNVLVVAPAKGWRSVRDLVEAARARPGALNYASVGIGTATWMSAEKFKAAVGIDALHVPYKGSPEAIAETMAGRVDYFFAPLVSALPQIKAGKLQALALGTPKRSQQLPDVPTLGESGIAGADYLFWIGMLVPSRTPRELVQKIHAATSRALQAPEVRERYAGLGAEPLALAPEQFDALIREEMVANAAIVRAAGIKPE